MTARDIQNVSVSIEHPGLGPYGWRHRVEEASMSR